MIMTINQTWRILPISLVLMVGASAIANDEHVALEEIRVTASGQALNDVAQPMRVFSEAEMQAQNGDTIGELLSSLPGISNASFGAGVGRPVIRGLGGNRVKMTINGTDSADVSAMSSDHAPMVDAANAEQLEVIYGPNTLRFGSGAMGGVVNMADSRFHLLPLRGVQGNVKSSASSADDGSNLSASVDAGTGPFVMHLDGFTRSRESFRAGNGETIDNTASDSQGINAGFNYIQENGHSHGIALSMLDYEYGVPNPDNDVATVNPNQLRLDAQSILYGLSPNVDQLKTQFTYIDYEHGENFDDTVVGLFDKTSAELKTTMRWLGFAGWQSNMGLHVSMQELKLCHDHSGCPAIPNYSNLSWNGAEGSNLGNDVINGWAVAHDTPMPITQTRDLGLFWIMERDWALGLLELGARIDQRLIEADPVSIRPSYRRSSNYYDDKTFDSASLSAALTWQLTAQKIGLSFSRSQRAPAGDELYWNGDHHATFSFQLDNPNLEVETAYSLDATWVYYGSDFQLQGAIYYYDFDGYIYNDLKSFTDPFHGNPVYRNEQKDAWFAGAEWQLDYDLNTNWRWFIRGDFVNAQLKQGTNKNLPRTPPLTTTTGVKWYDGPWQLTSDIKFYAKQTEVAENETETDAYQVMNVYGAYTHTLHNSQLQVYVKAHNLTDEFGRNHVSYLKELSPVVGRNISLGVNYSF